MKFLIKLIFTVLIIGLSTIFLSDLLEKHTKFGQKNIEYRKMFGDDTTSLWDKLWTDTNKCSSDWVIENIKSAFYEWSKSSNEIYELNFSTVSMDSQDKLTGTKFCTAKITAQIKTKLREEFIEKYKDEIYTSFVYRRYIRDIKKINETMFEYRIKKDELSSTYFIEYSEIPFRRLIFDRDLIIELLKISQN